MQCKPLRAWELGLITSLGSQILRPKYDMDAYYGNTFWKGGLGLVLRVEYSQKLDPTLNTSPTNIFAQNIEDPTLPTTNHILMVSRGSTVETLRLCWELGVGTPCEPILRVGLNLKRWVSSFGLINVPHEKY